MAAKSGTYKKRYKMVPQGQGGKSTTVALPPEVLERKAEEAGMSVEDFISTHHAVAQYDSFDGVLYTFEPIEKQP